MLKYHDFLPDFADVKRFGESTIKQILGYWWHKFERCCFTTSNCEHKLPGKDGEATAASGADPSFAPTVGILATKMATEFEQVQVKFGHVLLVLWGIGKFEDSKQTNQNNNEPARAKDSSKVNQEMKGRETTASRATWLSWNYTGGQGDQTLRLTWMFLDDVFILMAMITSVGTRWNKAVSDTCMPVVGQLNIFNLDTISIPKYWWDPQWLITKLKDARGSILSFDFLNFCGSLNFCDFPIGFPLAFGMYLSESCFLNLALALRNP